jgi:murein L,D-transpeptidase YafK
VKLLHYFVAICLFGLSLCQAASEISWEGRPDMTQKKLGKLKDPRLIVKKSERRLEVFDGGKFVKAYPIALGSNPAGDKEVEGDAKTPEGLFYIFTKNSESKFYLSLGVSYPSKDDAERGSARGLITKRQRDDIVEAIDARKMPLQKTTLGGEIYIHGGGTVTDWTDGSIALADSDIEELFNAIPAGTDVEILP